jgi:thymidylate synthase
MENNNEELQYINLIKEILEKGIDEITRNGNTCSIFGSMMKFSLIDGKIPILTTKKVAIKTCFEELMWFIKGNTDNKLLQQKNVKIWNENSTREFLDSQGLFHLKENDLGPVYGHQWRYFNAEYIDCNTDYKGKGIDQLSYIINCLKDPDKRTSRRLIISAWNPCQLNEMALPPCHIIMQFNVRAGKYLSCAMYQRSCDMGLGVPFNITSYSFLTHLIAHHCDLEAENFIYFMGNCHIYKDHIESLNLQIKNIPYQFPKILIKNKYDNIEDYSYTDIEWLEKYKSYDKINMKMIA